MDRIADFLKKFNSLNTPHKEVRECAAKTCSELLKRPIEMSEVRISGETVFIDVPPLIKGELLLHKKEVLDSINQIGKAVYKDIR